jgi:hypothetical protein
MTFRRAFFLLLALSMSLVASMLACSGTQSQNDGGTDGATDGNPGDRGNKHDVHEDGADSAPPVCHKDAGTPVLTALSVTSSADPTLKLIPAFSPSINDYYVRCSAGSNTLEVSMTASSCAETQLVQPTTSPSMATQMLSVTANEGQAIVANATLGKVSTAYWVRCLPHDFPKLVFTPHPSAGTPTKGYYLLGSFKVETGESGYAMALDSNGVPVWYFQETKAGVGIINVESLLDGDISFIPSPSPKPYEIHQLEPWKTTTVGPPGHDDEHELQRLENGHYLIFTQPIVTGVDMTGFNVVLEDGGVEAFGKNTDIHGCTIEEHDSNDAVVWSWNILQHLDPVIDCMYPQISNIPGPGGAVVVDPFHCNSIDVDPANGNLLVSARHTDSVFYVDKLSGQIIWKMGGSPFTKDNATYVSVKGDPFHRQHDARLQPGWAATCFGGSGQVSMFDDETATATPGRGVVYQVHVGEGDGGLGGDCGAVTVADAGRTSATVAWQYENPAKRSSIILGSFRIQKDGSRVIGWGLWEPGDVTFTEVDDKGHSLLDFALDPGAAVTNTSYRAIKVPLSSFNLDVLRNTAGHAP